jgi:hypothetical protein
MTKTYHVKEVATIHSSITIELNNDQIFIEHHIDGNDFDGDDSSIFLYFNPRETRNLFKYYKSESIEDLINHIHKHFSTYNSLKHFQDFLEKRDIHSTISSGCALTD